MGKKIIYYAIISLGLGAISYMYFLSDAGGRATFDDDIDEIADDLNIKK